MGGVAYVDWTARDNVMDALKDKHFRQVDLGSGCYQARRHIDDQLLPLRAHLDDQQFNREDDFTSVELLDLAQTSVTCEILSPEEALLLAEEEEMFEVSEVEDTTSTVDENCVAYGPRFGKSDEEPDTPHIDINEAYCHLEYPQHARPAEPDEPEELSLADYYMQLFGITKTDHHDLDETHLGICCKGPKVQYRSRPVWATT